MPALENETSKPGLAFSIADHIALATWAEYWRRQGAQIWIDQESAEFDEIYTVAMPLTGTVLLQIARVPEFVLLWRRGRPATLHASVEEALRCVPVPAEAAELRDAPCPVWLPRCDGAALNRA